jgi:hypothetical protein
MDLDEARRYAAELNEDNAGGLKSYADTPREGYLEDVVLILDARLAEIEARAHQIRDEDWVSRRIADFILGEEDP